MGAVLLLSVPIGYYKAISEGIAFLSIESLLPAAIGAPLAGKIYNYFA